MDPLSVSASVVGLLGAGAKITSFLYNVVASVRDAPQQAQTLLREMADIAVALGSLQAYVSGETQASAERGALIMLEHVLTTLTGCVTTYSDLQKIINDLHGGPDTRAFDKLRWMMHESRIDIVLRRLQNHKSSLTLMLTILQCQSMREAESSTQRLCTLIEEVLRSNQDLADRIKGLEREGSLLAETATGEEDMLTIRSRSRDAKTLSFIDLEATKAALHFTFEHDLQASRVYNRAISRHSMTSLTSTALYTTALSVFSNLSLSEVSNISFYALPVYSVDLSNSDHYVFGEEGALAITSRSQAFSQGQLQLPTAKNVSQSSTQPAQPAQRDERPRRLLGRFARTKRPEISAPVNPVHVTHVGYDSAKGKFTSLPREWKRLINEARPQEIAKLSTQSSIKNVIFEPVYINPRPPYPPPPGPLPNLSGRVGVFFGLEAFFDEDEMGKTAHTPD